MHHFSRALATARIDDLLREAAQRRTARLARSGMQEPHMAAASRLPILSPRRWTGRRGDPSRRDRAPMHQEVRGERS
jgi:hypothetical protein